MPRWGYALTAVLALALAVYVLWPEPGGGAVAPFPDTLAEPFTVSGALGEQRVSPSGVRVAGLDRAPERKRIAAFIARARALRVPGADVVEAVDAAAARAYGIDGRWRLVLADEERQWGETDERGAIWDPTRRRLFLVGTAELHHAVALAERLDSTALLELPATPAWIEVDGTRLEHAAGAWRFAAARPPAAGRVEALLVALRAARFAAVDPATAGAVAAHVVRLPARVGEGGQTLSLLREGGRAWLAADGLPPQPLSEAEQPRWLALFAALREDRLCDPAWVAPPTAVRAWRDGRPLLALTRRAGTGADGAPSWDVRWEGGSEPADAGLAERLRDILTGLVVSQVRAAPMPAGGLVVEVEMEDGAPLRVTFADGQAWSGGWAGSTGPLPPPLSDLRPESCFDPRPCAVDPQRVVKLQRRWRDAPERDEAYARGGGGWNRTHPAGGVPADEAAVARLARSLVRLRALAVRQATAAERAAPPTAELALRIAPLAVARTGAGADDDVVLEDTLPQDRAFALLPDPSGGEAWLMLDRLGGLAFSIDAGDAEELLAEVASSRLFPVAPALVAAVEVAGTARFRLERQGADWRLRDAAGERSADALAVRRLLRALAALAATGPMPPPAREPDVTLVVETVDGERLTAQVRLTPEGPLARTVRGTTRLDPAVWAQVVLDPAAYRSGP